MANTPQHHSRIIGPRKVGGVYYNGYAGLTYEVTAIEIDERGTPQISERDLDGPYPGRLRVHSTAWDAKKDRIIDDAIPIGELSEAEREAIYDALADAVDAVIADEPDVS